MSFELLNAEVDKGLNSLNRGIPMGSDRDWETIKVNISKKRKKC